MRKKLQVEETELNKIITKRRENLDEYIMHFKKFYIKHKIDKFGNDEPIYNPYAITVFFFKTINPDTTVEPSYTCEELSQVWDLFMEYITKINMEIGIYCPTLSTFAKFCGLSLGKLQSLRKGEDESARILVNKIFDEVYNSNMMLTQSKDLTAGATQYRMKYENEALEKSKPNVNVNIKAKEIDFDLVQKRLIEINRIMEHSNIDEQQQ